MENVSCILNTSKIILWFITTFKSRTLSFYGQYMWYVINSLDGTHYLQQEIFTHHNRWIMLLTRKFECVFGNGIIYICVDVPRSHYRWKCMQLYIQEVCTPLSLTHTHTHTYTISFFLRINNHTLCHNNITVSIDVPNTTPMKYMILSSSNCSQKRCILLSTCFTDKARDKRTIFHTPQIWDHEVLLPSQRDMPLFELCQAQCSSRLPT